MFFRADVPEATATGVGRLNVTFATGSSSSYREHLSHLNALAISRPDLHLEPKLPVWNVPSLRNSQPEQ